MPSLGSQARLGQAHTRDLQKVCCTSWLEWFESLPEGVQTGILEFMDTQAPIMAACQVPAVVLKAATPIEKETRQLGSEAPVTQTA